MRLNLEKISAEFGMGRNEFPIGDWCRKSNDSLGFVVPTLATKCKGVAKVGHPFSWWGWEGNGNGNSRFSSGMTERKAKARDSPGAPVWVLGGYACVVRK